VLAEFLDTDNQWAAAEQAARAAITAPTLFTRIRPYACAYAAMQAGNLIYTTNDPEQKQAHLDRALNLVKRRLEMGPLDHYATSYPLASVAIEAKDYETLHTIVEEVLPRFGDKAIVQRAAAVAAYYRSDYLAAVGFAEEWLRLETNVEYSAEAKKALAYSLRKIQEFADAHQPNPTANASIAE
jgi:hypothetical protein